MAFRVSARLRTLGITAVLVTAGFAVPTVASAAPHEAPAAPAAVKPTIHSVQQRLHDLAMKNDQLVEKYNQATNRFHATRAAAAKATKVYRAAQHKLDIATERLSTSAVAQYESGAFSATGALLSSDSGASYLDHLDTLSMLSQHNSQIVISFASTQKQAAEAKKAADHLLAEAKANRAEVADQRTETRKQIAKYKDLLATLNARQQAIWARQNRASMSASAASQLTRSVPASAAARQAVQFALDQVGKPYVFGAAGPDAYDCSGLTMAAWQSAGVSLPHSAADQYNYGTHVSYDQLQPGDLMFFYQPIGHVTIYIGNGMMVSAPQEGENVQVVAADQFGSDFTGATRLVG
jgi:cell wall-associated NlpC family hydrolase